MREYIDLKSIYADEVLESDNYRINYHYISLEEIEKMKKVHFCKPWYTEGLRHDVPYVTLFRKGQKAMMSDVPMEKNTNKDFIDKANGHVFIGGLGLGLIIFPLLEDDNIKSITVMEMDEGLINLVGPVFKKYDPHNKLKIIQGDVFLSHHEIVNSPKKFDSIYFDVWISIVADNFKEMEMLHSLYSSCLNNTNPYAFIDSWCFEYCKKIYLQTQEFKNYLHKQFPGKTIDIEKEAVFVDGTPIEGLLITDNYLSSKHRYSIYA